jgi:hypothetical protein
VRKDQVVNDDISRQMVGQGIAGRLAQILQRLGGWSYDEFHPVGLTADSDLVLSVEHAGLLYDTVVRALPRCYSIEDGYPTEEQCAMPDGVCHPCAREGRRLFPPSR